MKRALGLLGAVGLLAAGLAAASLAGGTSLSQTISTITQSTGGGHTPVTICHKPGTPAEQTLVVDDDSVELTGHLGHGDTLGPCERVVTTTGTTDTTPTDTTPTTPTPTTPGHDCEFVGADKDGGVDANGGTNDDCAPFPPKNVPVPPAVVPPVVSPPAIQPVPPVRTQSVAPKPKVRVGTAVHKTVKAKPHKPVKLTGNPKVDKCKDLNNGTMNCKGIVVTPGQG